jgi:ppGpp synthetase/RelA/SpoT-type nucleotidyltranferase
MIIDDFMARYEREYDFYQAVARLCGQQCETDLRNAGIRAIVTSRAKNDTRLREKIEQRHPGKDYQTVDAINQDIVDLAGVRIALYFPGNIEEVDKYIKDTYEVIKEKEFPPKAEESEETSKPQSNYEKRFSGYKARHFPLARPGNCSEGSSGNFGFQTTYCSSKHTKYEKVRVVCKK